MALPPPPVDLCEAPPLTPARQSRAYLFEAVEAVLNLGDFQKSAAQPYRVDDFCKLAIEGIGKIASFRTAAIFTVDAQSSDLSLGAVAPPQGADTMEEQLEDLIDDGTVAWAIRERRGITVVSRDGRHRLFLHVIATYARIRGLFVGLSPTAAQASPPRGACHLPDGAPELLSLFLRSVATSLESIEYIDLLATQNQQLQRQVDEKMRLLLRNERELANTRKLNAVASLAGGIAHEYNNALMSLMGYSELARMACRSDDKVASYLDKTTPVLERMSQLTSQLLAYSQGGKYRKESVDLSDLVQRVLATFEANLPAGVTATAEFSEGPLRLEGDLNQLQRALTALVTNAAEAVEEGGTITVRAKRLGDDETAPVSAGPLTAGPYLLLEIRDTGCGMDAATRERMFEPFFSTKFAGRGLSLAAVYGIVENHKGAIQVESAPGQGTRLSLYLPVQQHEAGDRHAAPPP